MRRRLLLILAAVQRPGDEHFRLDQVLGVSALEPADPRRADARRAGTSPCATSTSNRRSGRRRGPGRHSDLHLLGPAGPTSWPTAGNAAGPRWCWAGCTRRACRRSRRARRRRMHRSGRDGVAEILDDYEQGRLQKGLSGTLCRLGGPGADAAARLNESAGLSASATRWSRRAAAPTPAISATRAVSGGPPITSRGPWPRSNAS